MSAPIPWRPDRMPFTPVLGAIVFALVALTPSLLPRSAAFQGLLCGIAALIGYGVGALVGWIVRSFGVRLTGRKRWWAWRILAGAGAVGAIVMLIVYLRWQRELRELIGTDLISYGHLTVLILVAAIVFTVVLVLSRLVRAAGRFLGRQIARLLPARVAVVLGALIVGLSTYGVIDNVIFGRMLERLDSVFMTINQEFSTDLPAPTSAHLSGGPGSLVPWEDLGRQGRVFVANTPTAAEISAFSGRRAMQPVRAYVGVGASGNVDLREEAEIAVDELERTGGFDRAVINVATGTGRGWINENQAKALEFMWNGDVATVSMQYSYLPSWMSFLVDGQRAQDAGRFLFEAVYERWQRLPAASRPKLVISGESLGTFGGESAFSGAQDLSVRTDGALFVGPPGDNRLWSQFTEERDPGTRAVEPTYREGAIVRFSADGDTWPGKGDWSGTRVGYLQHANDPVTWWTWGLTLNKPDWLREPRGTGVLPAMRWIPVVTMLQVAADQMVANGVPAGHGHEFGQAPTRAWTHILPPPGWGDADTERLVEAVRVTRLDDIDAD